MTVADVNDDGNPDLLAAAGTSVALLLGDGAGGFSAGGTYATGFGTDAVTVADVNGDGQLDLAAAYSGDGASIAGGVSVLLGNNSGGFGAATSYAAGADPSAQTAADVNGDGTPDLIVANALGGDVSVLLGNGFGGFRTAVNYAAGVAPLAVVAADLNGDGKLDLAVADGFHQVDVLLGDGAGRFGPATTELAGSAQLVSVSATDMNGDGRPDLVAASGGGSVFVLLNGSAAPGSFTPAGAATAPGASTGLVVDTAAPPSITGTVSGQGVADDGTVRPFASAQVLDSRPSPTEAVVITVSAGGVASDANGILAGVGLDPHRRRHLHAPWRQG